MLHDIKDYEDHDRRRLEQDLSSASDAEVLGKSAIMLWDLRKKLTNMKLEARNGLTWGVWIAVGLAILNLFVTSLVSCHSGDVGHPVQNSVIIQDQTGSGVLRPESCRGCFELRCPPGAVYLCEILSPDGTKKLRIYN